MSTELYNDARALHARFRLEELKAHAAAEGPNTDVQVGRREAFRQAANMLLAVIQRKGAAVKQPLEGFRV